MIHAMKKMSRTFGLAPCVLILAALLAACSAGRPASPAGRQSPPAASGTADGAGTPSALSGAAAEPWPTQGWESSPPAAQGVDGALLDAALEEARQNHLALNAMVVVRHGVIVKEAYFAPYRQETTHELYSCTKSFISALTGIAIERRNLHGVSDPVMGFFPGRDFPHPDPRKQAMTVEDLLTMRSGLAWVEADTTYRELYAGTRDWVAYVLGQPMEADPGSRFLYSSGNSHVLSAILQAASGKNTYDFARTTLSSRWASAIRPGVGT